MNCTHLTKLMIFVFTVATVSFPKTAWAQELRYDAVRRIYTLEYIADDGTSVRDEIVPPNHIEPETWVEIESGGRHTWVYRYGLSNRPGLLSTQPLFRVKIDCLHEGGIQALAGPSGWGASEQFDSSQQRFFCRFVASDQAHLMPGDSVHGFLIQSQLLPRTAEGRFWGIRPPPPVLESASERPDVALLKAQAVGSLGGWYSLRVIAPGRPPEELSDPARGVGTVTLDLAETCELGWISNPGICNSLRVKLEQASRALERGNNEAAVGLLQAFLNELEAQHGDEPGKHVNDNAYWLLKVNVEFILERMENH